MSYQTCTHSSIPLYLNRLEKGLERWTMENPAELRIPGGAGFCNSVRRALISDIETWAASSVVVRRNTSCETDEFLSHRLGMVPLCQSDAAEDCVLTLRSTGPGTVYAGDLVGARARPVQPGIPLLQLAAGQEVDLDVHVDRKRAGVHPRYAPCAAVGMEPAGRDHHRIRLRSNDDRLPRELVLSALTALSAKVEDAFHQLAHQPTEPPKDMS